MNVVLLPIVRWREKLWLEGVLSGEPEVNDLISFEEATLYSREEAIEKFIDRGAYYSVPYYSGDPGGAPGSVVGEEVEPNNATVPDGAYARMINGEGN